MTTVTIGQGRLTIPLPLTPATEAVATPQERFDIALAAVDQAVAERGTPPGPDLRQEVYRRTGLSWAPIALAIRHRHEHPLGDGDDRLPDGQPCRYAGWYGMPVWNRHDHADCVTGGAS